MIEELCKWCVMVTRDVYCEDFINTVRGGNTSDIMKQITAGKQVCSAISSRKN